MCDFLYQQKENQNNLFSPGENHLANRRLSRGGLQNGDRLEKHTDEDRGIIPRT
jgi:hypothetical protein